MVELLCHDPFAMVLHRILDPGSKRRAHTWMRKAVCRPGFESIELPGVANDAFRTVGLRPPARVLPLS